MNIMMHELRMSFRSTIVWTVSLAATALLFMSMYDAFAAESDVMARFIENIPRELLEAIGADNFDFSTVLGFYGFMSTYIAMIASVFALKLGFGTISEEMRIKAVDFLMVKPVSRLRIWCEKATSVLAQLLVQNGIYMVCSYLILIAVTEQQFDMLTLFMMNLSIFLVQLFFVGFGMMLSVVMRRVRTVLPVALSSVFAFFIVQLVNQSLLDDRLTYVTPFAYFSPLFIRENVSLPTGYLLIDLAFVSIFSTISLAVYMKSDMMSS